MVWWLVSVVTAAEGQQTVVQSTAKLGLSVWSRFLTLADGRVCAFEPTCSLYARHALTEHGVGGLLLTADRLMREANAPTYLRDPSIQRWRDPVSDHAPPFRLLTGAHCRHRRRLGAEICTK